MSFVYKNIFIVIFIKVWLYHIYCIYGFKQGSTQFPSEVFKPFINFHYFNLYNHNKNGYKPVHEQDTII